MGAKETKTNIKSGFSPIKKKGKDFFFQPKLSIGPQDDPYEREADAVADTVMKKDSKGLSPFSISSLNVQRQCSGCEEEDKKVQAKGNSSNSTVIQKQDDETEDTPSTDFTLQPPSLLQPVSGPDFLSLRQPFIERSIFHLWDPHSALQVWNYNFNFFRRFGLAPDLSVTLSNLTAPRFIDSQLKAENPTWWEISDQELNTTTYNLSVPILEFDPDFTPSAPSWLRTLLGGGSGVQRKYANEKGINHESLQRKQQLDDVGESTESIEKVIQSTGMPLQDNTRTFMENRFGYDFSHVKIHDNTVAAKSAQSINALAYTTGNNIVFNKGQYAPSSENGKKLLAHELTHVVQQGKNIKTKTIQRAPLASPRLSSSTIFQNVADNKKVIELGDTGVEVRRIQQMLIDLGFKLPVDGASGTFTAETKTAVEAFQRSQVPPLNDDGRVGRNTMRAFDKAFPSFTLPSKKSDPWSMSCVLDILCPWNKNLVENVLPAFNIITFDSRTFPTETWDGSAWKKGTFTSGGFQNGNNLGFDNTDTCERFAMVVYHEGWHAQQPSSLTGVVDVEKDAYINAEQWSISAGIPGQTFKNSVTKTKQGLRKTVSGEVVPDETAAETLVKQKYGGVSSTPGERILSRVGADKVKVRKPDGSQVTRLANVGESVRGAVTMTNQKTIAAADWDCP